VAGVIRNSLAMAAARGGMVGQRGGCEWCRAKALGVVKLVRGVRGLAVMLDGAIPTSEVARDGGKVHDTVGHGGGCILGCHRPGKAGPWPRTWVRACTCPVGARLGATNRFHGRLDCMLVVVELQLGVMAAREQGRRSMEAVRGAAGGVVAARRGAWDGATRMMRRSLARRP